MGLDSSIKGWFGEFWGDFAHRLKLDPRTYVVMNDVTVRDSRGTAQIDHVIISRFGIFVVESKNMDGWIYGGEYESQWTQSLYGTRYRFQNPLIQNIRHIKALNEYLRVEESTFHSVVMFWGESTFKSPMPDNVLDNGYTSFIKSRNEVLFSDSQVAGLIDGIRRAALPRGRATRAAHIQDLDRRFGGDETCPQCGAALVVRTTKRGPKAGQQFLGCRGYPKCRFTHPLDD